MADVDPPVDDLFSKLVTSSIPFLHSSACCSRRVQTHRFSGSWLDADCSISGKLDGSTTCMQAGYRLVVLDGSAVLDYVSVSVLEIFFQVRLFWTKTKEETCLFGHVGGTFKIIRSWSVVV